MPSIGAHFSVKLEGEKKSLLSIKTEGPQGFEEGQRRQLPSILILNTSGPSNYSTGRIGFGQLTTERPRGCGIKRGWQALSNSSFLPSLEVFQNPLGAVGWSRIPKRSFHLYTWANAQDMHHPASPMTDSRGSSTHWAPLLGNSELPTRGSPPLWGPATTAGKSDNTS